MRQAETPSLHLHHCHFPHNGAPTHPRPKDRPTDDNTLPLATVLPIQWLSLAQRVLDCAAALVSAAVESANLHLALVLARRTDLSLDHRPTEFAPYTISRHPHRLPSCLPRHSQRSSFRRFRRTRTMVIKRAG
jgi:hypothetical protein